MPPYFFHKGIKQLGRKLSGEENVYLGVRPYGFHAGNLATLVVYPYLLSEEIEKNGKKVKFKFHLFINDWEQDKIDGPDIKSYPFNLYPRKTTFQYTIDPLGCHLNIVDHWEPIIKKEVRILKKRFPQIKINFIRNSSLKLNKIFKRVILDTIAYPLDIVEILRKNTNKKVLEVPASFAKAICPICYSARGETFIFNKDTVKLICKNCSQTLVKHYEFFDFWFYHKTLALPRLEIYDIDLCITGFEHYEEGDYFIRKALIKRFAPKVKNPITLYSPSVIGSDNKIMGKSKGNYFYLNFDTVYKKIKNSGNESIVKFNYSK